MLQESGNSGVNQHEVATGGGHKVATQNDLLYGVKAIADFLEIRLTQAEHLCKRGDVPTFRMGRVHCSSKLALSRWPTEKLGR